MKKLQFLDKKNSSYGNSNSYFTLINLTMRALNFNLRPGRLLIPVLLGIFLLMLDSCVIVRPAPPSRRGPEVQGPPPVRGRRAPGPPPWAPAHGYRAQTRYVYFPSIMVYYDLHRAVYIYVYSGRWVTSDNLPRQYERYNLRRMKHEELHPRMNPRSHYRELQRENPGRERGNAPGKGKPDNPGRGNSNDRRR
jgi:hypothetical protein